MQTWHLLSPVFSGRVMQTLKLSEYAWFKNLTSVFVRPWVKAHNDDFSPLSRNIFFKIFNVHIFSIFEYSVFYCIENSSYWLIFLLCSNNPVFLLKFVGVISCYAFVLSEFCTFWTLRKSASSSFTPVAFSTPNTWPCWTATTVLILLFPPHSPILKKKERKRKKRPYSEFDVLMCTHTHTTLF